MINEEITFQLNECAISSCDHKPTRPFRVITCAEDKQVNFYQGPPFRFDKLFDGHTRYPNQVRFAPDGSVFVSVGSDKKVCFRVNLCRLRSMKLTRCTDQRI